MDEKKKYRPGTQLPNTRLNKKTPQYVIDYMEKHQPKSADLMRLIQLGIEVELNREKYGIFIPYGNLSEEKIRELETNDLLKKKFMQFAQWFFFTEGTEPPPLTRGPDTKVKLNENVSSNAKIAVQEDLVDQDKKIIANDYMHRAMQFLDDDDDE